MPHRKTCSVIKRFGGENNHFTQVKKLYECFGNLIGVGVVQGGGDGGGQTVVTRSHGARWPGGGDSGPPVTSPAVAWRERSYKSEQITSGLAGNQSNIEYCCMARSATTPLLPD